LKAVQVIDLGLSQEISRGGLMIKRVMEFSAQSIFADKKNKKYFNKTCLLNF
jgi:hypothetical protein